jgi:hypothetical protein
MENLPNVSLAVGGAPCLNMQPSLFNFYTRLNSSFFEPARWKFDLTLKVFVTNHYIENKQKSEKKGSSNVIKKPPNVTKNPPNVIGLAGSKKGKTETANVLI